MSHFRLPFAALALALALLVLAGCEQTTSTFVINPDGSGKILYTATFPLDVEGPQDQSQKKPKTDDQKVAEARAAVLKSTGVEAWSDVSCTATTDGLISFKGTAYFKDLTHVEIAAMRGGSGKGSMVDLDVTKIPGGYHVNLHKKDKKKDASQAAAKDPKKNSVKRARTTWKYMRPLLNAVLANDVRTYTFITPKPAAAVQGFQKTKDGYSYTLDGAKLLKAMDDLLARPDAELQALLTKGDLMKDDALAVEALKSMGFDPVSGLSIDLVVTTPQFNYAKEVAAAQKVTLDPQTVVEKEDTDDAAKPATSTPGAASTAKSVRIGSISLDFPDPDQDGDQPEEAEIRVVVNFAQPVTAVGEATVSTLTDSQGKTIAAKIRPAKANLGHQRDSASFDMRIPSQTVSIGQLSGSLACSVGSGSKLVDLGVMTIAKKAKGSALEAEIDNLDNGWLHLKFKATKAQVKSVQVFTKDGKPYKVSEFQLHEWEGFCTKTLRPGNGDAWPKELQFKVEFYSESKPFTVPWSVSRFSLPQIGK